MCWYIGIDPGKSGSAFALDSRAETYDYFVFNDSRRDFLNWLSDYGEKTFAAVEHVWSSPQMGVASAFSFGVQFERPLSILVALGIPTELILPRDWQRGL